MWRLPGENAFLVSTWDLVAEAAGRVEDFSNRFRYTLFCHDDGTLGALETGALGPDVFAGADPAHTVHRRIFFGELTQGKVEQLEPYVTSLTDELLDALLDGRGGDAAAGLAHPLPMRVVAGRIIGFPDADVDQLQRWMSAGSRLTGGMVTLEEMAALSADVAPMLPWTESQLDGAMSSPSKGDVLGAAAAAIRRGALSHEEAAFTLMVLVGAGAETTASLIGIAIGLLARHPLLQDELRADPSQVPAFVEEVLRFESPFRYHPRTAAGSVELGGVEIPEGALVLLSWSAANRDSAVFEHPDELILHRRNAHLHLGFGRGVHHCVGAPLARLEARVALRRLLERTTSFALDPERTPRWFESIWIHRHEELPLVVDPR